MVLEAPLEQTEHGLFAAGPGWFVLNMREVRWWYRGHGFEAGLSGRGDFPQVADVAYARFPDPQPTRYQEPWLPGGHC